MKKRLANQKTRSETGLDYVISCVNILTPFGRKALKDKEPFFPGEESLLEEEFGKLGKMLEFAKESGGGADELLRIFMEIKDIRHTVERSGKDALSVVELFEIKSLLLKMERIAKILADSNTRIPEDYLLMPLPALTGRLDPRNDRMDTFYLYDEFSEKLKEARKKKRETEGAIRREKKKLGAEIMEKYGIELTPRFDCTISKTDPGNLEKARNISELAHSGEDYVSVTFEIRGTEEIDRLLREEDDAAETIEREELAVREELSRDIAGYEKELLENCLKIGELDVALAKALYAANHNCVIPVITTDHIIQITGGRHLHVEDILSSKGKGYCPVSISLSDGVTCITGANMGGKTVSLKLAGLVSLLAQNAFFVPCEKAVVGLSNFTQILIGDNQSIDRGLSGFGSEMESLKEILDNGKDRSLILVDEIAGGTNPAEGFALTMGLIDHLKGKPYISLFTTHFDVAMAGGAVTNLQVAGLAGADFDMLDKEIRYADRRDRISIIAKYMDYRLLKADKRKKVPRDALNIAGMLGIDREIIEKAKKYLEGGKHGKQIDT